MTKPIHIKNLMLGEGIPKICVSLMGTTEEKLKEEAREAVNSGADLVEWRADFYEDLQNTEKMKTTIHVLSDILGQMPLLFTIRTRKEGGNVEICTSDYIRKNMEAAGTGKLDLADVEVCEDTEDKKKLIKDMQDMGVKVIASFHDFEKTEDREALKKRFCILDETGADILKVAEMPKEFEDTAALMQITKAVSQETDKLLISISMGNTGSMSRIAGENFGSCITFGYIGTASAPGQFPVRELRMMMESLHEKNKNN